jgi:hypothetical protein
LSVLHNPLDIMWGSPTTTVVTVTMVQARTVPQEVWHVFETLLDHSPTILYVSLILTALFFGLALPVMPPEHCLAPRVTISVNTEI